MAFLPKQAADSCLRRARRFLRLAQRRLPVTRVSNDLRRMALVMAVAAIDSYMHAVILRRIADVRKRADLPKALARQEIPFSEIADLADTSIDARHNNRLSRPWVQVKTSLQKRLLKETFQTSEQVANALAMAGVDKAWSKIAPELGEKPEDVKKRLDSLVHRRNQIVHEGDMKRASRPQRLKFNDIDHVKAQDSIDWVDTLIKAMDKVVTNHP